MNLMSSNDSALDPRSDAKLSLDDEEPDCECCRERDLAHICAWMESILRGKKWREDHPAGSTSASLSICVGAIEVEADESCPHCSGCPTSCTEDDSLLQNVLGLPAGCQDVEHVQNPGCEALTRAEHKLWAQTCR